MREVGVQILSRAESERIHCASLELLKQVGVQVEDEGLRTELQRRGALVEHRQVRMPPKLVEAALRTAPREFVLHDRDGGVYPVPSREPYIASRVLLPRVLDYGASSARSAVREDVKAFCTLAEALGEVQMVLRVDCAVTDGHGNAEVNNLQTIADTLCHTTKHCLVIPMSLESLRSWLALTEAAIDGSDISRKPPITVEISTTSPLRLDAESARILLLAARTGLPIMGMPMPASGGSAPITQAATLTLLHAETLFVLVTAQLLKPGIPCFYGGIPCTFELRKANISLGSPSFAVMTSAYLELGRSYDLPLLSPTNYTDSVLMDEQCGLEKTMALLASHLSGADIVYGCGSLGAADTLSLEQVVLDLDILVYVRQYIRGISVEEETIAMDVIKRVGAGGHFLKDPHTLRWLRSGEQVYARASNREGRRPSGVGQLDRAHSVVTAALGDGPQCVIGRDQARALERKALERQTQLCSC